MLVVWEFQADLGSGVGVGTSEDAGAGDEVGVGE